MAERRGRKAWAAAPILSRCRARLELWPVRQDGAPSRGETTTASPRSKESLKTRCTRMQIIPTVSICPLCPLVQTNIYCNMLESESSPVKMLAAVHLMQSSVSAFPCPDCSSIELYEPSAVPCRCKQGNVASLARQVWVEMHLGHHISFDFIKWFVDDLGDHSVCTSCVSFKPGAGKPAWNILYYDPHA